MSADDETLLRQAQMWLEVLVPLSDVDPECTVISVSVRLPDEDRRVLKTVSLADTMTALQIRCGKAELARSLGEAVA